MVSRTSSYSGLCIALVGDCTIRRQPKNSCGLVFCGLFLSGTRVTCWLSVLGGLTYFTKELAEVVLLKALAAGRSPIERCTWALENPWLYIARIFWPHVLGGELGALLILVGGWLPIG